MSLQAIKFDRNSKELQILDQLFIPYLTTYIQINSIEDAYQAIKKMQVRGAPAIAIVGAFSIVVEINKHASSYNISQLIDRINYLVESRPTAVNLSNLCNEIVEILETKFQLDTSAADVAVLDAIYDYAIKLYDDDLANNFKIGANGVKFIRESLKADNFTGPFSIITICNTGSLATSGHGTALGIIRTAYDDLRKEKSSDPFFLEKIYPCETRPYNQGAKLTTYELNYEKIPFTLICDNMVTSLISSLNSAKSTVKDLSAPVKFIIAGADRIVQNGDSANKIGTYQLAAIADFFNQNPANEKIRFLIAAPKTTIDTKTESGSQIIIEERPANELTTLKGPVLLSENEVGEKLTVGIATPGIDVWNPAFDVTPHTLIDGIVTEDDVVYVKDSKAKFT